MEKPPVLTERQFEDWCKAHQKQVWDRFEAQRDADVEWYEKQAILVETPGQKQDIMLMARGLFEEVREQARQDTAREICEAYDAYIKLLGEEIDSLMGLAISHGWRDSPRVKAGEQCREKIQALKAKYIK